MASINEAVDPSAMAAIIAETGAGITFGELEDRSRQLAHLLRERGLGPGSHVAVLLENHVRYFEVCWAAQRSGLYITPINWHLGGEEAGYILSDCEATALVTSSRMSDLVASLGSHLDGVTTRLSVDGGIDGFEDYETVLAPQPTEPLDDETEGSLMLYSSGTTGHPKGILPPLSGAPFGTGGVVDALVGMYGFGVGTRYLVPAPLYHAAPLGWSMGAQRAGGTVVVLERFDPTVALAAIEEHRVTHAQFVPTHFVRMLKLDEAARTAHDLSSLQMAIHAAAPCPVEVKRQMLEWWGPIIHEYYSGSEGVGFCAVGPDEWLEHPGTVGKALMGVPHIVGEDGEEVPVGRGRPDLVRGGEAVRVPRRSREDGVGLRPERLGHAGRRRLPRRRRLPLPHRPRVAHDHLRGREHLSPGDRGRPHRPPRRGRRRGHRRARRRHG